MLIYNVTIKVSWAIHDEWLQWMRQVHMPAMAGTGCFTRYQLVKLLETDEEEGPTYAAQYYASSHADYHRYLEQHAPALRAISFEKWGDQFIAFRSVMEIVN